VHPKKEFLLVILAEPLQRLFSNHVARTLHFFQIRFLQAVEIKMVVVEVKAAIEAETSVQYGGANHRTGDVPVFL
jgi:hypothetical protein